MALLIDITAAIEEGGEHHNYPEISTRVDVEVA